MNFKLVLLVAMAMSLVNCVSRANYIEHLQELPPVESSKYAYVDYRTTGSLPTNFELSEEQKSSKKWNWELNLKELAKKNKVDEEYFFEEFTRLDAATCIQENKPEQISEFKLFNPGFMTSGGSVPVYAPVVKPECKHEGFDKLIVPITTLPGVMKVVVTQGLNQHVSYEPYALVGYAIYDFKTSDYQTVIAHDLYLDPEIVLEVETKRRSNLIQGLPIGPKVQAKLDEDKDKRNTGLNVQMGLLVEKVSDDGQGEFAAKMADKLNTISVDFRARYFYRRLGLEYSWGIGRSFFDVANPDPTASEYTAYSPYFTTTRQMIGGVYAYALPQHAVGFRGLVNAGVSLESYAWNDDALVLTPNKTNTKIENAMGVYLGTSLDVIIKYYYASFGVEYHRVSAKTDRSNVIISISPLGFKF